MTRPIKDTDFLKTLETFRALAIHPRFTDELAAAIRKEGGANKAVEALLKEFGTYETNPFALSVDEILNRLRRANEEEGWGITEEVFKHLAETAPALPEGHLAFLSLRIRFGEGDKGVEQTFEAHFSRIQKTFSPKFWRWEYLRSGEKHLRLLAGNKTHASAVEWITFDLDAHRKRDSIEAVRRAHSLADEGLVFTWLYPEYACAIDYKENPAFFLAGYELNVPEFGGGPWQDVPLVGRDLGTGGVGLGAGWRSDGGSDYSVPSLRE